MTRIFFLSGLMLATPAAANAGSMAFALARVDGSAARIELVDHIVSQQPRTGPIEPWRISAEMASDYDADGDADGDVRLKLKLRPNRAMGRVAVAF